MSSLPPGSAAKRPATSNISEFTAAVMAGTGMDIKDMQRNALSKQYDLKLTLTINESANPGKPFFSCPLDYSGVPYPFVVVIEDAMVQLLDKLVQLGKEIATGGEAVPPT